MRSISRDAMNIRETSVLAARAGAGVPPALTRLMTRGINPSRLIAHGTLEAMTTRALIAADIEHRVTTRTTVSPLGPKSRAATVAATNGSFAMSWMGTTARNDAFSK